MNRRTPAADTPSDTTDEPQINATDKLTEQEEREIVYKAVFQKPQSEVAEEFKVSQSTVSRIVNEYSSHRESYKLEFQIIDEFSDIDTIDTSDSDTAAENDEDDIEDEPRWITYEGRYPFAFENGTGVFHFIGSSCGYKRDAYATLDGARILVLENEFEPCPDCLPNFTAHSENEYEGESNEDESKTVLTDGGRPTADGRERIAPENIAHPEYPTENTGDERYARVLARDQGRHGNIKRVILYDRETTDEYVVASYHADAWNGAEAQRKVSCRFTMADGITAVEYDDPDSPTTTNLLELDEPVLDTADIDEFGEWLLREPGDAAVYLADIIHDGSPECHVEEIGRASVTVYDGVSENPLRATYFFD